MALEDALTLCGAMSYDHLLRSALNITLPELHDAENQQQRGNAQHGGNRSPLPTVYYRVSVGVEDGKGHDPIGQVEQSAQQLA